VRQGGRKWQRSPASSRSKSFERLDDIGALRIREMDDIAISAGTAAELLTSGSR
jgi:hypothetical protein